MAQVANPPAQPRPLRAALWMTGAIASFSAMAVAGREVAAELDTFETMMYRSFIGVGIVVTVAAALGRLREVSARHMHLHLIRNISHFAGQNLWFYSLTAIPLAQVFAFEFSSPLWVTLFAPLILGERLTRSRAFAALIGFAGILIVARPGAATISPGLIAAATAALGFAGSLLFTKLLTRHVTTTCILFWLTVMQAVMGILMAGYDGDIALPSSATLPYVIIIGIAGLLAHLCITNALSIAPATVVVPLDFLRLPIIALVGMAVYGEALDPWVLLGSFVILSANYLNIRHESRSVSHL